MKDSYLGKPKAFLAKAIDLPIFCLKFRLDFKRLNF